MGHRLQRDLARAHGGKVVLRRPLGRVGLAVDVELPGLERLEPGGGVTEELQPDLVEVGLAAHEGHSHAPVVGVAPQRQRAAGVHVLDDVGGRGDGHHVEPALGEVAPFPLRALEDRAHAGEQRELPIGRVEGDADGAGPGGLDALDLVPKPDVARVALGPERLVGPDDVLGRHRGAVGEAGLRAQRELDPGAVGRRLHALGEEAVEREGLVIGTAHQGLVGEEPQLPGHRTLQDVGVEAVEGADLPLGDPAALRRVGVHVGQVGEVGGQGGLPIHGDPMRVGQGESPLRHHGRDERQGPRAYVKILLHLARRLLNPMFR